MSSWRTCSRCGAAIYWAVTAANGKRIPLDLHTHDDGNVRLENRRGRLPLAHVLTGEELDRARDRSVPLYVAHFATCTAGRHPAGRTSDESHDNVVSLARHRQRRATPSLFD